LTAKLNHYETKRLQAAVTAADAESILQTTAAGCIETEHDMERTSSLTQAALKRQVAPAMARHCFDLELMDCAPYGLEYDRSCRYSILFGKSRGHVAVTVKLQKLIVPLRVLLKPTASLHS
jgi:U3 small nucleolar RNA-associated protein 7